MTNLAGKISRVSQALKTCNEEWQEKHEKTLEKLLSQLPSGAGFDQGTRLLDVSDTRLILQTAFHHMNENGHYVGWTDHKVTVIPTFQGLDIRVGGRNKNDVKDYIAEVFHDTLSQEA